jgi:hypothetical protein
MAFRLIVVPKLKSCTRRSGNALPLRRGRSGS